MGWDNLNNINLNSKPTIDSSKDGFQEYEVEQDIVFTVKYKVLAKDNSDLIDNKIYLDCANLQIDDEKIDQIYDLRVKNWGTENVRENTTGKKVVKSIWKEFTDYILE